MSKTYQRKEVYLMPNVYYCFIGWEERCIETIKNSLEHSFTHCIAMYSEEYADRTIENRVKLKNLCEQQNIKLLLDEVPVYKPAICWNKIYNQLSVFTAAHVTIDITCMPRSVIWTSLGLLEHCKCTIDYLYGSPESYGENITAGPLTPWIQPKQSGIPDLEKEVALITTVGFDTERTEQLIKYFSPKIAILFGQDGTAYDNEKRCQLAHENHLIQKTSPNSCSIENSCLEYSCSVTLEFIDAYSPDHGFQHMYKYCKELLPNYNIIMGSLGPKPTAISIYNVHKELPETALVYAPYSDISEKYSSGFDKIIKGTLN